MGQKICYFLQIESPIQPKKNKTKTKPSCDQEEGVVALPGCETRARALFHA